MPRGRHARPAPRYVAAGVLAILGSAAAGTALVTGGPSPGRLAGVAATVALAAAALGALLALRGLARAGGDIIDAQEESARHVLAMRRDLAALAPQFTDETHGRGLTELQADLARIAGALAQLQRVGQQTGDELGERMRRLTEAVRVDPRASETRLQALEAQLQVAAAQTRALTADVHLRLTTLEATLSGVGAQLALVFRQVTELGEATRADRAGRADLAGQLAVVRAHLEMVRDELSGTARQVAALRAEQEGGSYVGQTSAVRMTLPLVRAALRQTETPTPGDPAGGVMAGDVGQVTYAAPRADGPDDGAGDPGPGGAGEVS